jgi:hypothetical protein
MVKFSLPAYDPVWVTVERKLQAKYLIVERFRCSGVLRSFVPNPRRISWPLKMGPIFYAEMSVNVYQPKRHRKHPLPLQKKKKRRPQRHGGGNVKYLNFFSFICFWGKKQSRGFILACFCLQIIQFPLFFSLTGQIQRPIFCNKLFVAPQ